MRVPALLLVGKPRTVRRVRVVDSSSHLMQPPVGYDQFAPFNVALHGITPQMVADAPRFAEIWPLILEYIGDSVVVAHNAAFDLGVIRDACSVSGLPWPSMRYACTLVCPTHV